MEHHGYGDNNYNWCDWNDPKILVGGTGRVGNQILNRGHSNYDIVKIGLNTAKSPGDLRRFALIQTPVKDHQLMLVSKKCKE